MALSEILLPEFDQEMAKTRRTLERVPEDKFDWKPHEKSMTLGRLATHLATLPSWTVETIKKDELDLAPAGAPPPRADPIASREELLSTFDRHVASGREAIAGASDEIFARPWSLLAGGQKIFTLPRAAVLRNFVLNHNVHHRAQLGVYLRLNDIPVPSIYGPSADEEGM
jgi:uncharacterized damage-inducible protein DinB